LKTTRTFASRFFIICLAFAAALAAASCPVLAEPGLEEMDGLYVLTLEGSPREMGRQQGELMKKHIRFVYKAYLKDLVYNTWTKEYAILKGTPRAYSNPRKAMAEFASKVEKDIPDEYLEEMKGLAEGAGIDYVDVLIMTAHVDYFAILCSTLVATGPATTDGKLVEARNLDWAQGGLRDLDRFSSIIVVKPEKGHAFASVGYPGLVGVLTAVNDAKVTVELNFSMAKENGESGMPALILMRKLAQYAGSLDEAEQILRDAPRFAGYNITVTDGKTNEARLIEVAYGKLGTKGPVDNTLVSTNHFITDELAGNNVETSQFSSSPSQDRFDRLTELLSKNSGKIDPELAISMIHDGAVKVPGTVQTIVFKPADDLMWVWSRNREASDFVEFEVDSLLGDSSAGE